MLAGPAQTGLGTGDRSTSKATIGLSIRNDRSDSRAEILKDRRGGTFVASL